MPPTMTHSDTVQNFNDNLRDTAEHAGKDLRATANRAGQKVREFIDTTSGEVTDAAEKVNKHIHEKPVQSTLIALGVGFVLGALFRR